MDCTNSPLDAGFIQLAEDTLIYYSASPVRPVLIGRVVRARDALHPPTPAHPPNPARSYHLLGAYLHLVQGLAGTPNGASEAGTGLLIDQAADLRRQILAAYPAIHHPPNPAQPDL